MKLLLRKLFYRLSPRWRFVVRRLVFLPYDIIYNLVKEPEEIIPPKGMIYTGGGDFKKTGQKFVDLFVKYGNLKPNHAVLDVGSGIGRLAIPLTKYLDKSARYEGFDVVKAGVNWCRANISSKYPNFNFQYFDLHNDLYKADGVKSTDFIFPFQEESFDFVFLISVFTHMTKDEVEHYLHQIHKSLKQEGYCFSTFFIVDDDRTNYNKGFMFKYDLGDYLLMDESVQGANVAFKYEYISSIIEEIGFEITAYKSGTWKSNEKDCLDFQDIVIFKKR